MAVGVVAACATGGSAAKPGSERSGSISDSADASSSSAGGILAISSGGAMVVYEWHPYFEMRGLESRKARPNGRIEGSCKKVNFRRPTSAFTEMRALTTCLPAVARLASMSALIENSKESEKSGCVGALMLLHYKLA